MKNCMTVKKSEWDSMSYKTKKALAEMAKVLSHITPEELDKIKNSQFNQCGCKQKAPTEAGAETL